MTAARIPITVNVAELMLECRPGPPCNASSVQEVRVVTSHLLYVEDVLLPSNPGGATGETDKGPGAVLLAHALVPRPITACTPALYWARAGSLEQSLADQLSISFHSD